MPCVPAALVMKVSLYVAVEQNPYHANECSGTSSGISVHKIDTADDSVVGTKQITTDTNWKTLELIALDGQLAFSGDGGLRLVS